MDILRIIKAFEVNGRVFKSLLMTLSPESYLWKPEPSKWCILEIVCHLYDEEREDFRARIRHILEGKNSALPPINPPGWVTERRYLEQDFSEVSQKFYNERQYSIDWLKSMERADWGIEFTHPSLGAVSPGFFLENWLAHDYHHIRQINRLMYEYHRGLSENALDYAGDW